MTIKQQGGIFGRNQFFKDVEVENLTSTGETTLQNLSTTNSPFNISSSAVDGSARLASNGFIGLGKDPSYAIDIADLADDNQVRITASNGGGQAVLGVTQGQIAYVGSTNNVGLGLRVNGADKWRVDTSGNLVVVNSGNGIDFSATSGTGTSELFSDYEEGAWSPVYAPTTGAFTAITSVATGRYTKIGRLIHLSATIYTSGTLTVGTASGNLKITGLPYSNNASLMGGGPNVSSQSWNLATDKNRVGVAVPTSASHITLYDNTLNGASFPSGNVEVSDMNVAGGGFSNLLTFNITYET